MKKTQCSLIFNKNSFVVPCLHSLEKENKYSICSYFIVNVVFLQTSKKKIQSDVSDAISSPFSSDMDTDSEGQCLKSIISIFRQIALLTTVVSVFKIVH